MVRKFFFVLGILSLFTCAGCGYTTKSNLSENFRTVSVLPVTNAINISSEINDRAPFRVYRPGIEVEMTNALINRFVFDGSLKVVPQEKADLIVEAKLIDYRRDALRYSESDDIQEYRLSVVLDVSVKEAKTQKVLWHDVGLAGDTSFFLSGSRADSEDAAAVRAVEDTARRVVDKTIEVW